MLKNIEIYILLFFTYAFAGWVMESFGGMIFNEKKFINRGFLIGPYCPVYGVGVVAITLLLGNYTNDIVVLFILATLICGTLEYLTSYIMEKLFNARWWDYHNKRFNINGRVCLETLVPFGLCGSVILRFINPFFINIYSNIPELYRHIIVGILALLFIIDFCISFKIILGFKGEVYSSRDNTEEIGEKVRDKTEEVIKKAGTEAVVFGRKVKLKRIKLKQKIRYTRKKISDNILSTPRELADMANKQKELLNQKVIEKKEELESQRKMKRAENELKQKERKEIISKSIQKRKEDLQTFEKISREKVDIKIKNIKESSEEFTKQIKEKFSKESYLQSRLMKAFPNMQIKKKEEKKK